MKLDSRTMSDIIVYKTFKIIFKKCADSIEIFGDLNMFEGLTIEEQDQLHKHEGKYRSLFKCYLNSADL